MDAVNKFLNSLTSKGVKLWAEGDKLNCRAPKGALTVDDKQNIAKLKPEILQLINGPAANHASGARERSAWPQEFPLSAGEKGLYILQQLHPDMRSYNVPLCLEISSAIDVEKLTVAWEKVLQQYPILTARMIEKGGMLYHQLGSHGESKVEHKDIEFHSAGETVEFLQKQIDQPIDLNQGPLTRIALYSQAADKHILLITIHHIIFDGISSVILLESLFGFYYQLCSGKPLASRRESVGYHEFVAWEETMLKSKQGREQAAYWRKQLAGELPSFELLPNLPHLVESSFAGETLVAKLPTDLVGWVHSFSRAKGMSPSTLFLAVFKLLLHKYSGQDDIIIGMPVMGRAAHKFRDEIGYFVNMVPLRTTFGEQARLGQFLRRVQSTMLDALYHSAYPFPLMTEMLEVNQTDTNPVFQVSYAYQNFMPQDDSESMPDGHQLIVEPLKSVRQEGEFELALEVYEEEGGYNLYFKYHPERYDRRVIEALFEHYCVLFQQIKDAPDLMLDRYPVVTEQEKQQLLIDYNATAVDYGQNRSLPTLFAEQARRIPERIAVRYQGESLSYGELYDKSRQVAVYLRELGVKRDSLVGICVERSLDMLVGLLGVLQAGGAYVPLDPDYPEDRLAYMLEDSGTSIVLTQTCLRAKLERFVNDTTQLFELDGQWQQLIERVTESDIDNRQISPPGELDLAYVIYTSGSTGKPKGVMIEHRALVNFLLSMADKPGLNEQDKLLAVTTYCFDIAGLELYLPLIVGAELCISPTTYLKDGPALKASIEDYHPTVMQATPATWELLFQSGWKNAEQVKVLCGGEALPDSLKQRFVDTGSELWNMFGPTETTIWSTLKPISGDESINIGKPIANTQIYILDAGNNPQPIGVAGELCISGVGLARGYLNRPELTAEKFVEHPYVADERIYRTGDLARWLDDGNIEYLGRIDTQVKVRGFRIETGEIESRLNEYSAIEKSVVVVRGEGVSKHLVAFYVSVESGGDEVHEVPEQVLMDHLGESLPEYMVPTLYVSLASIPLTPNGKVNRRALSEMELSHQSGDAYVAPRSESEKALAAIWAQLLKLEPDSIGVQDNFFRLGGHSLLVTQLTSQIREQFEVELPLKVVFEKSTIEGLAECISEGEARSIPAITRIDRGEYDSLPLSYAQERLWFIDQLDPGNVGYNIPGAVKIHGDVDAAQLELALQIIVDRHDNLRTVFPEQGGRAEQVIVEQLSFSLPLTDLSDIGGDRDAEARRLCLEEANTGFDLSRGPLFRGRLLKLSAAEHILMLNMHHIISDGWSLGVLIGELKSVMESLSAGESPSLPELPIQYVDYSVWQRRWLEEGVLERQLSYWEEKLSGVPEALELSTDYARPSVQDYAGDTESFELSADLLAGLKGLSESSGCTLYMTLLSVFKTLLYRYTGQGDICIGSPIANRQYGETEGLIGMFVNTLALRTELSGEESFRELMLRVKGTCLEGYEHQDTPFEKIVELVQPDRNMAISPLFQVMFILQNQEQEEFGGGVELYPLSLGVSKFDLTLEFNEGAAGLAGSVEYSTALFKAETIERFIGHYVQLCEAVVADPESRLSSLEYLSSMEREQLLLEYNATQADYPRDRCIHELFIDQVELTPDAVAAEYAGERLSYRELYEKSQALALYLQSLGVVPDTIVGICMERSLEMLIGILGVVQAGGAYLPLDPDYPDDRLAHMLEDSKPSIVLSQSALLTRVAGLSSENTQLIDFASEQDKIVANALGSDGQAERATSEVGAENLAYVIYTSGSTGLPKGVMVEHRGVVNEICYVRDRYGITSGDVQILFSTMSFDLFVEEIFTQLTRGGKLLIEQKEDLLSLETLNEIIQKNSVTTLNLPTAFFHQLVVADFPLASIKTIIVGGEALDYAKAKTCIERNPSITICNSYGPTETTIISAMTIVNRASIQQYETIPIGSPIANTQIYILDQNQVLVPVGVAGEVHIAGDGLARGYLNQAELTAEKFVPNPFLPGSKMYKTGDLAKWLSSGEIEYLGRTDTQIKIRGFRVEMGEIESRLNQHVAVKDSVVVAQGKASDIQLVAFYVKDPVWDSQAGGPSAVELKAYLNDYLPQYMLPAGLECIDAIPLTPNGKADRRALASRVVEIRTAEIHVAARNAEELQMVAIWADVLGLEPERIGVNDNFFELGGHSLLATQIISRIRSQLNVSLPLKTLFENPSVAQLNTLVGVVGSSDLEPILAVDRSSRDYFPLSFSQERLWFINQLEPDNLGYSMPAAFSVHGEMDVAELEDALNLIVTRHENLRTVFPAANGKPQQRVLDQLDFHFSYTDLSHYKSAKRQDNRVRQLCLEEANKPFDLAQGPLIRGCAIKLSGIQHILMMNVHHIVSDGWSYAILIKELGEIMEARGTGRPPDLPLLPIQYVDFAAWQRSWLESSSVLEEQLAYWKKQLADVPEVSLIATDYPRSSQQNVTENEVGFTVESVSLERLRAFGNETGSTLYMVLLTVFKALLYRYTGQEDLCIGSPIANRQYAETENLIGMFVNTQALRSVVDQDDTFITLLSKIRSTCLEAYDNQDAPFEKIVELVQPDRNMAISPLFQVMFILQNQEQEEFGGGVELYPLSLGVSKFDLTLEFSESAAELNALIRYRTSLYKAETMQRLAKHFVSLCKAVLAEPSKPIAELVFLDADEQQQLLVEFNDTQHSYPADQCVHDLFVQQANRTPDNRAVFCAGEELSYRELDEKSTTLAVYLQSLGVVADTPVGILMHKSLEMMIGILGVLKAGGAYLPLDPNYPAGRLEHMLSDSQVPIVLTQSTVDAELGTTVDMRSVELDREWDAIVKAVKELEEDQAKLQQQVSPENLAYVIYTSGSTGQPKGAANIHRGFTNLNTWYTEALNMRAEDRVIVVSNVSFDLTQKNLLGPLLIGASVYLIDGYEPLEIRELIDQESISWINCTPSAFSGIIEGDAAGLQSIRSVVLGGEAVQLAGLRKWFAGRRDKTQLINGYGPSEASAVASYHRFESLDEAAVIGKPIHNVAIHILDKHNQLQPIGVAGELCISGVGLARGYLNRPELTAEKFVEHPYVADERIYRTGDLARWLDDGNIEYLGRIDTQVKVRGFRIETGEIESQLIGHPEVEESAVIARGEGLNKHLVAFYVSVESDGDAVHEVPEQMLMDHLGESLPEYMVPSLYVSLSSIPLTPNGKVNRRALSEMELSHQSGDAYVAPRSESEKALAAIWAQLLKLEPDSIGVQDNFFRLGGHSLLVTQLTSQIREQFEVELPLKVVFEKSTIEGLAECISEGEARSIPAITRIDRGEYDSLPLSYAQERLWFIDQLDPGNVGYNIPGAVKIHGDVDAAQLELALQIIVDRHDNLRTVFPEQGGRAEQVIVEQLSFSLPLTDLSDIGGDRDAEARRLCLEEANTGFDLSRGPLFRGRLLKLSAAEHILMLNMHHIISDGWSLGVLIGELKSVMESLSAGESPSLPELPIQYVDYSVWQRRWLEEGVLERQLSYWEEKLSGVPEALELSTDYARPSVQDYAGDTESFELSADLLAGLKGLSESSGCTLYMTLLSVFKTLLYRYTGQGDICIGSPIANRQYGETEGLIGMFVNTLALRTELSGEESFRELMLRVKGTCLEGYEHQDTPFEKIVELVQPDRNMAISPLFQVMFILQNQEQEEFGGGVELYPLSLGVSKFDLTLEFNEGAAGLAGSVEYSTALFKAETIERFIGHYVQLCEAVVADPESRLSSLEYLSSMEREQLLLEYNATQADYPRDRCIHELFIDQVELTPDAVAAEYAGERLSYRELYEKSQALALYLQSLGVVPDTIVGICMERSLEMLIGILGVVQAGGAYLPLDPDYPDDRLAYMLEDSSASIVLTQQAVKQALPAESIADLQLVELDQQWASVMEAAERLSASGTTLSESVSADDLAYVIYTSGSTGKPKGVLIEHRALVNRIQWMQSSYELTESDVVLQKTPYSFDVSVWEFFWPVMTGASIVFAAPDGHKDPVYLADLIRSSGVTTLHFVPSMLMAYLSGVDQACDSVRQIFCSGEALPSQPVQGYRRQFPQAELHNLYGPTEAAIDVTAYDCSELSSSVVPIGKPISNIQMLVLDKHNQLQPIGVAGELCISGVGLARGYLNRPELTAEKFVAHPYMADERIYRTGDLARWLDDGNIEYLGRIDTQVKVRGFRIETGEIESQLIGHPEVEESAVIARGEGLNKHLVAFYVSVESDGDAVHEVPEQMLMDHLGESLPEYMVPSLYVSLSSIPLTPNGKVNRRALSEMELSHQSGDAYVAPRSESEKALAAIWAQLLKLEPDSIGVQDNFFRLGGHSLLVTQLTSQIREQFEVELPLKVVFEKSTIEGLAECISEGEARSIPAITRIDRGEYDSLPLSYAQERLWFIDQLDPGNVGYNIPGAVKIHGDVDAAQLELALQIIVDRHDNLRTVFPEQGGRAEQVIVEQLSFSLPLTDLSDIGGDRDAEARRLCLEEANTGFDLSRGPLFRGRLLKLSAAEHILMLNMHHIISDGWSLGVLIGELKSVMESLSAGESPSLPELPIQYVDYSVWQRRWLEEGVLERQLSYWEEKLSGVPEALELSTDYARPSVQDYAGDTESFELSADLLAGLKGLSESSGCTLYMTLLSVFKTLLYRYTGQGDICIGSPIANRQYGETEGLIGMFVNTLALRTELSGEESFRELMLRVKGTCLEGYEHQDTPFEKIVELVQPDRNMAISPLFQVMFILQNQEQEEFGGGVELYPLSLGVSKFDLTLEFNEGAAGLAGSVEYSTALFKAETIERFIGHYVQLCEVVVADPESRLSSLEYLSSMEREQLLLEYNATQADYPRDRCIHELFIDQVELTPDAVAAEYAGERLSYRELYEKSQALALYLRSRDIQADSFVGVCLERSLDMLVALLGVLQAGGAYVPLDPTYPKDRLTYMLKDSDASIVLSQADLQDKLSGLIPAGTEVIELDRQWPQIEQVAAEPVKTKRQVKETDLAYVIYTSGSTGQPKGVAIEHRSAVSLIHWAGDIYSDEELAGVLAATSICFDLSVYELFLPLSRGGRVVLVPNVLGLIDLPDDVGVSLVNTVPSAMEELLKLGAVPDSVQTINLAGEPLSSALVNKLYDKRSVKKVYDLYGPSEDTTYSTYTLRTPGGIQTIGKPISNTQVYILDSWGNVQPIGVPGELHLAGSGLARGYLNRPELTAEKFVGHPLAADKRMYRTGDLARWLDDGNIEYLGRVDSQVKVRGFRIETGEIEARLVEHPGIDESVVIALGDDANKQLVAFYVTNTRSASDWSNQDLNLHLAQTLPDYMVPAAYIKLDKIPLSPNGKVDRRALSDMPITFQADTAYLAPRTPTEHKLVSIWAEVLAVETEKIGISDSFFQLGGHSLLAAQLMAKINAEFDQLLPLSALFTAPDIQSLANVLNQEASLSFEIVVPIQNEGNGQMIFAVPGVGGNVLSLQPLSNALGKQYRFYGLQAAGLDGQTPSSSVEETASLNIAAMRRQQPSGPYFLLGHSYGGVVAYEMSRQLLQEGEQVEALVMLDSVAPSVMQGEVELTETEAFIEASITLADLYDVDIGEPADLAAHESIEELVKLIFQHFLASGIDLDMQQFNAFYQVYRANEVCYRSYTPGRLAETPAVVFRALEREQGTAVLPKDYGWKELLSDNVEYRDIQADHFSMLDKPFNKPIADYLARLIDSE